MSTDSDAPVTPEPETDTNGDEIVEVDSDQVRFGLQRESIVPIIAIVAGVLSVLTGQEPTGNALADVLLAFAFGTAVVGLGHVAPPPAIVASAVLALFFTGLQLPAVVLGLLAVGAAILLTSWRRFDADSWAIGAAVCAGFISQTVLALPSVRFAGSASILAAVAVAPVLFGGYWGLNERTRQLVRRGVIAAVLYAAVASILAVIAALGARDQVESGIEQAQDGVAALQDGDQPQALTLLTAAQADFEASSDRLGGPMTWPARFVPVTAQHSRALETAAEQGSALAATAARTAVQADVERIRGQNGQIDLDLVDAVNVELTVANRTLASAQQSLNAVSSPWLLPLLSSRLDEVGDELATTAIDIDLANHATSIMPRVLGANGLRRYMVLFVQPAESREFGGFVGAYGLVEIDQGRFSLVESGGIDVDFGDGAARFSDAGAFPESFVRVGPQFNPQNLTATADLPTIAAAVRDLAPQWRQDPDFVIDGVITVDPYALAGMLELTGPLPVEGRSEPVDATNVVDFLLRDQYIDFEGDRDSRQDALRELAGQAFNQLFTIDIPGPERLGAIFGPAARANRLSIATFDDEENAFFDRVYLSANFPTVGSAVDMIGIFTQTGTASKLDGYASRSTNYDVTFDPETGQMSSRLVVTERNDAPPDVGTFVLGAGDQNGPDGNQVVSGTNYLAMGLYTRASVDAVTSSTPYTVQDALPALSYDRHNVIFTVPQGGEALVSVELSSQLEPDRYDVFIPAQATANAGDFTLTVRPVDGWRVKREGVAADGSWSETFVSDEARGLSFTFERTN